MKIGSLITTAASLYVTANISRITNEKLFVLASELASSNC